MYGFSEFYIYGKLVFYVRPFYIGFYNNTYIHLYIGVG